MEFKSISEELSVLKLRKSIEREVEDYFESKGFNIIEPDIFQNYDDYLLSNYRQNLSSTVKVLGGDSKIYILRPDITTNILGKIFSRWEGKHPLKVYYNSKVYRNLPGGRINENYQVGVESLGEEPQKADQEILEMAIKLMDNLKTEYVFELGSSIYLDSYLNELELSPQDELQIRKLMAKKNKAELLLKLKELEMNKDLEEILSLEGDMEDVLQRARNCYMNDEMKKALDSIHSLFDFFKEKNLLNKINLDLSMVADLDYYDGIIFKGYCKGIPRKVISGGRYDKLTKRFGKDVWAVGFMMDVDIATQLKFRGGI